MSDLSEIAVENQTPCGCGRSATGFCTGLHALSDEEWDARVFDEAFKEDNNDGSESVSCSKS